MKANRIVILLLIAVFCLLSVACGQKQNGVTPSEAPIADGVYTADFNTDSTMFHVNEANNGKGVLTVKDGKMTIHIALASTSIINLYAGTADDAQKEGAELIEQTFDTVTYSDGTSEEVSAFDLPVPCLDDEFDCAILGKKGKWYDHKVSVTNPVPMEEDAGAIADGEYTCEVALSGGSGKASVESPAKIVVKDGKMTATVFWSSTHYEYMTVGETQYDRIDEGGNSTFEIPVELDTDMAVSALTTAMSEPHLIDYTLHFDGATLKKAN